MTSLARRRREQVLAQRAAEQAGIPAAGVAAPMPEDGEGASEYRVLLAALHEDLRQLGDVQSISKRNPMKAEMAGKYGAWLRGVLEAGEAGKAAQDEILVTNMIWAIDYRDIDFALDLAEHAIKHGLALPERYNRTTACFVAETIAEIYMAEAGAITPAQLARTVALADGHDMPDEAGAKVLKAVGRASFAAAEAFDPNAENAVAGGQAALYQAAADAFKEAIRLHDKCGAKLDLKQAETRLKQLAPPE